MALFIILTAVPFVSAESKDITVISAEKAKDSNTYTVKFSAPVTFRKSGWVWLRQANAEDGTDQINVSSFNYVGDNVKTVGSETFSDTVELVFPEFSAAFDTDAYGISIVEYFLDDTNEGYVSPLVVSGENGEMLKGTYSSSGLDFCWIPTAARDADNNYSVHLTVPQNTSARKTFHIVSAMKYADSNKYRLVFSAPAHIFKDGYVWLRQAGAEDGTDQVNPIKIEYVGDNVESLSGNDYSEIIELTFPDLSDAFDKLAYGISIVEYFLGDDKNGYIPKSVIMGLDGEYLEATYQSDSEDLDFCWIPTDGRDTENKFAVHIEFEKADISITSIIKDGKEINILYSADVALSSLENIKASSANGDITPTGVYYTGYTSYNGTKYSKLVTLEFSSEPDGKTLVIPDGVAADITGTQVKGGSYSMDDFKPDYGKDISSALVSGKLYSFMNCDTGRMLTLDGSEEFRVFKEDGENIYSLRSSDGKKYLSFDKEGKLSYSDSPFYFNIYLNNEYERYQLRASNTLSLIYDDDGGDTDDANTAVYSSSSNDINTGWYITLHGDTLPMRVAMVGDSITNGCTPDGSLPKAGCRAKLSSELVEKYGRVVFVGSAVASHGADGSGGDRSTLSDAFLYREEGHNGWVVSSHEGYAEANNYGIDTLRENLQTKYKPDIICMMIGINDINQLGINDVAYNTNGKGDDFFGRWETLVNDILEGLPENGRLIIGTFTPGQAKRFNERLVEINAQLVERVETIAKTDARISWTSNYDYVNELNGAGISTDGLHLNADGYSKMADSYYDAILKVADGVACAYEGEDTFVVETEENPEPAEEKKFPFALAVIGGAVAIAIIAAAVIITKKHKK